MHTIISLLRGINVSGQKKIKMADLKSLYESLGFSDVVYYLQSGNVIFKTEKDFSADLENHLENKIHEIFGYEVTVINRQPQDIKKAIIENPYSSKDTSALYVTFFKETISDETISKFEYPTNCNDECVIKNDHATLFLPTGAGKTKLTNKFLERKLGTAATSRNWKTVNALLELSE